MKRWGEIDDYPELDFSPVMGSGRYTIRCETEQESQWVLAAMKRQYPDNCRTWTFPHDYWSRIRYGKHLDMQPNLNVDGDHLRYSSDCSWAENNGQIIIGFKELLINNDLGEIAEFESCLDLLF